MKDNYLKHTDKDTDKTTDKDIYIDQKFALMQLSDSFFPSGSFTLSHGLESLVQSQQICSVQDLADFLKLLLHNKIGSTDAIALRHAYRASANESASTFKSELLAIDADLFAQTLLQQTRTSQCKSGRALLMVAQSTWPSSRLDWLSTMIQAQKMHGLHPIIFAVVGHVVGLDEEHTVFAFLHSFLTGLCGAAIRLGVIGHVQSQILLKEMAPVLSHIIQSTTHAALSDIWSCTPLIDIAQQSHQALPQKLFSN